MIELSPIIIIVFVLIFISSIIKIVPNTYGEWSFDLVGCRSFAGRELPMSFRWLRT